MKNKKLLITAAIFVVILIIYIKGCVYLPISGTVVEAETDKPIEGAVVLVEWTITRGAWIGLSSTTSYKVEEALTDRDGKFKINSYVIRPFINKPSLTIYKAGYVCWNNEYIFPDYKHREDFKWKSKREYLLERFLKDYSYVEHQSFMDGVAHLFTKSEEKKLFIETSDQWERDKVIKERQLRYKLKESAIK